MKSIGWTRKVTDKLGKNAMVYCEVYWYDLFWIIYLFFWGKMSTLLIFYKNHEEKLKIALKILCQNLKNHNKCSELNIEINRGKAM